MSKSDRLKSFAKAAGAIYLVVAVGIDHFILGIPWAHTLTDPLTIVGAGIGGLLCSWIACRKT